MCSRAWARGFVAVLVSDTSGQRGPATLADTTGRLHGMRGVAPEIAGGVFLYVSLPTGDALRQLARLGAAQNSSVLVSFLSNSDNLSQQSAWLAYYEGWVVAACVFNGLLVIVVVASTLYLRFRIGIKFSNNSLLALVAAGVSALLLVIFAGAAYQRARPFLSTPGYYVLADLNEAFQVVALALFVQSWAAAAAHLSYMLAYAKRIRRALQIGVVVYLGVFIAFTIACGFSRPLILAPPILNLAALVVVVAAFSFFGGSVLYAALKQTRGRVVGVVVPLVRRTVAFVLSIGLCVLIKLVLTIVALAEQDYVIEPYDALQLAVDVVIVASIVTIVVSQIPALRRAATASTSLTGGGNGVLSADPRSMLSSPRGERMEARRNQRAEAALSVGAGASSATASGSAYGDLPE